MKRLKKFENFDNDKTLFPYGGVLGGPHKKYYSDEDIESGKAYKKGYKNQSKGITNSARLIEDEKRKERKINLMGNDLSKYGDKEKIERLIKTCESYITGLDNYFKSNIEDMLRYLPEGVAKHFNINLISDDIVDDFIKNKYELFKRSYNMFKEIKDYSNRYGE